MISLVLALTAITLTGIAYGVKRVAMALGAAFAWLLLGIWGYQTSTAQWDLYYGLFWFSLGMALAIIVDSIYLLIQQQAIENREERQAELDEKRDEREQDTKDKAEGVEHPIDKIRREHGLPPSEVRARRKENRRLGWR